MNLPIGTRICLFFKKGVFGALVWVCNRNKKHQDYIDIIDKGEGRLEEDFDLYNIIENQKDIKFQIEKLNKRLKIVGVDTGCGASYDKDGHFVDVIDLEEVELENPLDSISKIFSKKGKEGDKPAEKDKGGDEFNES